jgi:two-component system cell cycle response regulator
MSARVLVVDDIPVNVKLLEAKLSAEYFEVLTAGSGEQALAIVEQQLPDVVLLDVMMPGLDGFEVCRRIKANPKTAHVPVVMVTALNDTASRVQGLEAGADDFLSKPASDLILYARVRSLARLKSTMDEWRLRVGTCESFGLPPNQADNPEAQGPPAHLLLVQPPTLSAGRARTILEGEGHRVTSVGGGAEALAVCETENVDVIIIGLASAGEDGLRLCSQLRSQMRTRQVPIMIVVEESEMGRLAKALDIGISDYLVKPVDGNELIARVRTQVRRWRYQRLLRDHVTAGLSLAVVDGLTGAYNRRYLTNHLERLIEQTGKDQQPLSVALFDIDHFKSINDSFGHAAGDEVLKTVVRRAAANLRASDTVARYGGEEFVVVMPGTDEKGGMLVAERLRQRVAGEPMAVGDKPGGITVTVSIGVAGTLGDDTPESLLKAADTAMYRAKAAGRNRVELAQADVAPRRAAV